MTWAFIWLMFVLKIPIIALLWIVWHAINAEPLPADEEHVDEGGGGWDHPRPRKPRPPRRGPHADPPPASPSRVRAGVRMRRRAHG
jgi:hypothetical protein